MKKMKKIIAAAMAMMTFTASNIANVSGMQIQAEAEQGIVMAHEEAAHTADSWSTDVVATHVPAENVKFIPASSNDMSAWYHGISKKANDGQYQVAYEQFTVDTSGLVYNGTGIATGTTTNQVPNAKNIYLLNKFYVQSSGDELTGQDVYIKDLTVTGNTNSAELDKALRVGFVYDGGSVKIYNGLEDATTNTTSYNVNGTIATTSYLASETTGVTTSELASSVTIPAYTAAGTSAKVLDVYVWFEGEDAHLKSTNLTATLDNLSITFAIGNKIHD